MRGFLIGAIIGALGAVLVAPRRGEETREMVRTRVDLWQDQMMNKLEQARGDVQSLRHDVLARLDDMRSQFGVVREEMKIRTERPGETEGASPEPPSTGI